MAANQSGGQAFTYRYDPWGNCVKGGVALLLHLLSAVTVFACVALLLLFISRQGSFMRRHLTAQLIVLVLFVLVMIYAVISGFFAQASAM